MSDYINVKIEIDDNINSSHTYTNSFIDVINDISSYVNTSINISSFISSGNNYVNYVIPIDNNITSLIYTNINVSSLYLPYNYFNRINGDN